MNKIINNQKPWIAIVWFAIWGIFQTYAVSSVIIGTWKRPEAFPEAAYNTLIYPDILFIPLYIVTSYLLFRRHKLGNVFGFIAGGAVIYVMVYLLALSGLKGTINLVFDSIFLTINIISIIQIVKYEKINSYLTNYST